MPDVGLRAAERELERQQALMLEVLRAAPGRPVTYRELQQAGVEYPASVAEELELAGVALERVDVHGTAGQGRGVRLSVRAADEGAQAPGSMRRYTTGLLPLPLPLPAPLRAQGRAGAGALIPGLVAAVVAAAVVVAILATRSGGTREVVEQKVAHSSTRSHTGSAVSPPVTTAGSSVQSVPATPAQPAPTPQTPGAAEASVPRAVSLEARGHALLESGDPSQAVPVLEHAVAATGGSLRRCAEPQGEACLTYAYALYDLGSALRRVGRAAEAIAVLELRLQIANQRPTVAGELGLARREARTGA